MKVKVQKADISSAEGDIILTGIFEGIKSLTVNSRQIDKSTSGFLNSVLRTGDFKGKLYQTLLLYPKKGMKIKRVLLVGLGKRGDFDRDKLRGAISSGAKFVREIGLNSFLVPAPFVGMKQILFGEEIRAIVEGVFLGLYTFEGLKTKSKKKKAIKSFFILVNNQNELNQARNESKKAVIVARAVSLARDLVTMPGNNATPRFLAKKAKSIAKKGRIICKILSIADAEKLGMGLFLSVAKGSREPAKFIILEHMYRKANNIAPIVLVGKAITFDSGGISLKPSDGMEKMKDDMSGGAAVLGIMQAVSELQLPVPVVGIIPATENLPGGNAYKPGDVVQSLSGKTVEIITTDAEGRLILADALTYALHYKPWAIVDLATLTGACIVALGNDVAGMMGNDEKLMARLKQASVLSGEKLWQLPLWDEYNELLKSDIADMKNVGGRPAGTITGGCFLKEFVEQTPWVHLDIAGPCWTDKDKPYIPKGATGVGVRLIVQMLETWAKGKK